MKDRWHCDIMMGGVRCIGLRAVHDAAAPRREMCVMLVTETGDMEVALWRESQ